MPSNAYKNASLWKGNLNLYFKQILNGTNISAKHVVMCTNWIQNETQTYLTGWKHWNKVYFLPTCWTERKSNCQYLFWSKTVIHLEFPASIENLSWKCSGFYVTVWPGHLLLTGSPGLPWSSALDKQLWWPWRRYGIFFSQRND